MTEFLNIVSHQFRSKSIDLTITTQSNVSFVIQENYTYKTFLIRNIQLLYAITLSNIFLEILIIFIY